MPRVHVQHPERFYVDFPIKGRKGTVFPFPCPHCQAVAKHVVRLTYLTLPGDTCVCFNCGTPSILDDRLRPQPLERPWPKEVVRVRRELAKMRNTRIYFSGVNTPSPWRPKLVKKSR